MVSLKRSREPVTNLDPTSLVPPKQEDLAINPKKLKELTNLFNDFKVNRRGIILILRGPSGSGKSTALKCCADANNLPLQSWSPQDIDTEQSSTVPYLTQLLQYLKIICSVKKSISIPGCKSKPVPRVVLLRSLPVSYTDQQSQELTSCLQSISRYSDKLICFVFSDISLKILNKLFGGVPHRIIE